MPQTNTQELRDLSEGADEVVFRANAFFPFQLFPDSITVDKNKIDIVYRQFFWTKRLFTILLDDLTTIKITTGPLFSTVYFEVRGYEVNPEPVTYLKKADAIRLRDIVIGLAKAKKENVNLTKVTDKKVKLLEKIGNPHEDIKAAV